MRGAINSSIQITRFNHPIWINSNFHWIFLFRLKMNSDKTKDDSLQKKIRLIFWIIFQWNPIRAAGKRKIGIFVGWKKNENSAHQIPSRRWSERNSENSFPGEKKMAPLDTRYETDFLQMSSIHQIWHWLESSVCVCFGGLNCEGWMRAATAANQWIDSSASFLVFRSKSWRWTLKLGTKKAAKQIGKIQCLFPFSICVFQLKMNQNLFSPLPSFARFFTVSNLFFFSKFKCRPDDSLSSSRNFNFQISRRISWPPDDSGRRQN